MRAGTAGGGQGGGRSRQGPAPVLLALILACLLPEAVLQGADLGLWGSAAWRRIAYENGAFWPGLLDNWRQNWAGQRLAMFVTYGFLHAGILHLGANMLTLLSLGGPLLERLGTARFLFVYLVSLLGGAAGFALLAHATSPMVGASGALFGLAAGVIERSHAEMRAAGAGRPERLRALLRPVLVLVALNVVMYWAMDGLLAWQTHLGGFLGGLVATWAVTGADPAAPRS